MGSPTPSHNVPANKDREEDFLPLGSVVLLKGATKPTMIVARCLAVSVGGTRAYFDYGGCAWPEGLVADQVAYFNADGIQDVVARGFSDAREKEMSTRLSEIAAASDLPRGNAAELRERSGREGASAR